MSDHQISFILPVDLATVEEQLINKTIAHYKGSKRKAAEALGMSLKTIYNKLEKYSAQANRHRVSRMA